MKLLMVYCNHESAPLQVRERLAFSNAEVLEKAYSRWRDSFPQFESVILSTCNRVEICAATEQDVELTSDQVAGFLSEFHEVPRDDFVSNLQSLTGAAAAKHLFEVTASLDSMVLGEPQIVNQVKEAYRSSQMHEACGPITNLLFQRAVSVSAKIRSDTRLSEGRVSIASVAVGEFGKRIFNRFDDKRVLVIGAGEMAEETLRYLNSEGATQITIVNRNADRARKLADEFGGKVVGFDHLDNQLKIADVVVSTTGATDPIMDAGRFEALRSSGNRHTIFILDLGAPRDFESGVGTVDDNVFLYDIDDLKAACEENRNARSAELETAAAMVASATDRFMQDIHHRGTGPLITRLRSQWSDISQKELELLFRKNPHLGEGDREAIQRTLERVVNKLLHPPLETLKDESKAGTPQGLMDALRQLFQLKD
ncbi:MAG: glutamyl-tRNA reductase [Planctomycetaceae bacterium]